MIDIRRAVRKFRVHWLATMGAAAVSGGCGDGACVTHDETSVNGYFFCVEDRQAACQQEWCDDTDTYCAFFQGLSCGEVGLGDLDDTFSEPETPTWSSGDFVGGGGGGTSSTGACTSFSSILGRVVCSQNVTASGCSGKFLGAGTTCLGVMCTSSSNPFSCSAGGGGGGACTTTYQGPTGDVQVSSQCMSIWNYRCVQGNTSAADQNCLVYDSLDATVACPYCP